MIFDYIYDFAAVLVLTSFTSVPAEVFCTGWSHDKVQYNFETWQTIKRKLILVHVDISAQQGNVYGILFVVLD